MTIRSPAASTLPGLIVWPVCSALLYPTSVATLCEKYERGTGYEHGARLPDCIPAAPDTAHNILKVGCYFHCAQDPGAQEVACVWVERLQSQGWSTNPSCFTSLKDSQDRVPCHHQRSLGSFGAGSELGTIARSMRTLKLAGATFLVPAFALWPPMELSPLLAALPYIPGNLSCLKINTCMRRVRSAASSPCRRARSVRREVVCSCRACLSARCCLAAASCSL